MATKKAAPKAPPITEEQYYNIEAALLADPPEITGKLVETKSDGTTCHCALGKLAKAAGITDGELRYDGYDALAKSAEAKRLFGIGYPSDGARLGFGDIYKHNDAIKRGSPLKRAESVLRGLRREFEG